MTGSTLQPVPFQLVHWCLRKTSPGSIGTAVPQTIGCWALTSLLLACTKGLYCLECVHTGAVINQVNSFHLKPFHAGDDAEPDGGLDSAEQKDSFDEDEGGGLDGGERQGVIDGDEQENGLDGEQWQGGFDGDEQEDGLDEMVDDHWLSCDVINRAQSLLKEQFPQQTGLQSTNALKEGKKWKSVPEQFEQIINDNSHWICTSNRNC